MPMPGDSHLLIIFDSAESGVPHASDQACGKSMPIEILVVDDDRATRQWLCSVLDAEGYACHVAHNTQEAEEVLHRTEIQLALVDIYLGEANGVKFLQRIKAIQPDCDCVMMTAHASVETMAQSVKDGAVEYLGKPLRIDDLLGLVRRLENRRQSRRMAALLPENLSPRASLAQQS